MPDVFTREERSRIMSLIRSTNTKVERDFAKLISKNLYNLGYRYRRNYRKLLGKPDMVFVTKKVAIFIDGDFWHGYKFDISTTRLTKGYWREKIAKNMERDKYVNRMLKKQGWRVIRIWEHELKKKPLVVLNKIIKAIS